MTNKTHRSIYKILALIIAALSISWLLMLSSKLTANAQEEAEPYGVYTNIVLDIGGRDSEIYAAAKNKFTLGNSTIIVNLYLYSSEVYTEDYSLMNLEVFGYSGDLDQGKTLRISAETDGRQLYWRAVLRYKFDDRAWAEKQTRTVLFNEYGQVLN